MKARVPVAILALSLTAACGAIDDAAVDDPAVSRVTADEEPAPPAETSLELTESARTAFEQVPAGSGWPTVEEFEARWSGLLSPFRLLKCGEVSIGLDEGPLQHGPVVFLEQSDEWAALIDAFPANHRWTLYGAPWTAPRGVAGDQIPLVSGDRSAECLVPQVEEVRPSPLSFGSYVYAVTLTNPDEPVRVETNEAFDEEAAARLDELSAIGWTEAAIQELIDLAPPSSSHHWGDALVWAKEEGRDDLAYEIHRRYRPVGFCSRDTRPLQAKKELAELCQKLDRPRCALAITTELLAYRVSRRSDMWIGGKPVTYESELDALPEGLDVPRFMLGLLLDYPGTDGNDVASISPRFFALAVQGTRFADALRARLKEWLADEELDTWNRHRLALALFILDARERPDVEPKEHAAAIAELAGVPETTRAQLRRVD